MHEFDAGWTYQWKYCLLRVSYTLVFPFILVDCNTLFFSLKLLNPSNHLRKIHFQVVVFFANQGVLGMGKLEEEN